MKDLAPEKTGARKLGTKRCKLQGKAEQAGSLRRAQPLKLAQFLNSVRTSSRRFKVHRVHQHFSVQEEEEAGR